MIVAEPELDLPDAVIQLGKAAPLLERAANPETRNRIVALDRKLAEMERCGYEVGTPARVRQPTRYTYAEWHIPIKRAGARCVLSFFINEVFEAPNDRNTRKQRSAARCR